MTVLRFQTGGGGNHQTSPASFQGRLSTLYLRTERTANTDRDKQKHTEEETNTDEGIERRT